MTDKVDIKGIDKAELLAALFNNSQPMGMGMLQAHRGPEVMSVEQARQIIDMTLNKVFADDVSLMVNKKNGKLTFDYLFGRPLKISLEADEVDPWGYDRDNGGDGTLANIVENIRREGNSHNGN